MSQQKPAFHPRREENITDETRYLDRRSNTLRSAVFRKQRAPFLDDIDSEKIKILPATAEEYYGDELATYCWEGVLKVVLSGTRDDKSPLRNLGEHEDTLVREIHSYISNQWAGHVKLTIPAAMVGQTYDGGRLRFNSGWRQSMWRDQDISHLEDKSSISNGFDDGFVSFARCGHFDFPPPADRNVNMLPFIFGSKESLPKELQCYHPLIEQCPYMREEIGKVGYLTVHESYVDASKAQRREGLHIESPGMIVHTSPTANRTSFQPAVEYCHWGWGRMLGFDRYEGGIFMASSVSNTSQVWDALVDKRCPGIVDKHGGCEYLRSLIGKGTKLQAGELVWMTDCTPHEALPQEKSGYRQFFRVVSPYVSHWYADHCTRNPKVDLPGHVKVVTGSKFEKGTKQE